MSKMKDVQEEINRMMDLANQMLSKAQDMQMQVTKGEGTYRMMVQFPNDSRGPRESKSLSYEAAHKVVETMENTGHKHSYKSIVIYSEDTGETIYQHDATPITTEAFDWLVKSNPCPIKAVEKKEGN